MKYTYDSICQMLQTYEDLQKNPKPLPKKKLMRELAFDIRENIKGKNPDALEISVELQEDLDIFNDLVAQAIQAMYEVYGSDEEDYSDKKAKTYENDKEYSDDEECSDSDESYRSRNMKRKVGQKWSDDDDCDEYSDDDCDDCDNEECLPLKKNTVKKGTGVHNWGNASSEIDPATDTKPTTEDKKQDGEKFVIEEAVTKDTLGEDAIVM